MNRKIKLIILWLITVVAMILHANYHVSETLRVADFQKEEASEGASMGLAILRNLFYHLPIVWAILLMYLEQKVVKLLFLILSVLYLFAHSSHLIGELQQWDPSQTSLLSLIFVVACILCFEHYRYWAEHEAT